MPVDIANTVLNASPYFDDYSEDSNFHKVLFRPSVAVQARELNQVQSIFQNQIEKFGNHVFKDGSVIKGCSISYLPSIDYVSINDQFVTNTSLSSTNTAFVNAILVGNTTGTVAQVISAREGFKASDTPARFFIRYTKPGSNNESTFSENEYLNIYTPGKSYIDKVVLQVNTASTVNTSVFPVGSKIVNETSRARGFVSNAYANATGSFIELRNVRKTFLASDTIILFTDSTITGTVLDVDYISFANSLVDSVQVIPSNSTYSYTSLGVAYGVAVSNGIIFHKGNFITVNSHITIVNESNTNPAGKMLYFNTTETIVKPTDDSSLYDNASGTTNLNAPGAHRLKLTSQLVVRDKEGANSVANTDSAFPIVEFSNNGPIFQHTNPEYNMLGDELAKRTYEESGHYVIKPFSISTNISDVSTDQFKYEVSQGLAYVKGKRIEFVSNQNISSDRGIDSVSESEKITSMSYGNYVVIKEVVGYFPIDSCPEVIFYNTTQTAITNERMPGEAAAGTIVGYGNIRAIKFIDDGVTKKGNPSATYRLYIFNYRPEAGYSFQDARAIVYNSSGTLAFADIVLTGSEPEIQEANGALGVFSLNARAIKNLKDEDDNTDTNYYFTGANTTAQIAVTNGAITFGVGSLKGELAFSDSSDTSENLIEVILKDANTSTIALSGTVTSNSTTGAITGSGTTFTNDFVVGECIQCVTTGSVRLITAITSNTSMTVNVASTTAANTYKRFHIRGSTIALNPATGTKRSLTVAPDRLSATINLGVDYSGTANVNVRFKAYNNEGTQLAKVINRDCVVIINTSTNVANSVGPWSLGLPDVFRLTGVYTGSNTSTFITTQNKVSDFVLDDGQQDTHYNHSSISLSPQSNLAVANLSLMVQFDCFSVNATSREGFFSVESYPANDSINANTYTTIKTSEIPTYSVKTGNTQITYDLRDVIDFRPYKSNTANVTSSIASVTTNPAILNTFNANTTTYNPYPSSDFVSNFTYYLGRKDRLVLTNDGEFKVVKGLPDIAPRLPPAQAEVLTIAEVSVPPYPSLTDVEKIYFQRTDYNIKSDLLTNKRFTMKDISILEKRIERLEYYTTLTMLESVALQTSVFNTSGDARFQNGFFVDPFSSHVFGRTDDLDYRIAIDEKNGVLRPAFIPEIINMEFDTNPSSYSGVQITGGMVTLTYTHESYVEQPFASDPVNVSGVPIRWAGTIDVRPRVTNSIQFLDRPLSVGSTSKVAASYESMKSLTPGTSNYGWWRQDIQTSDDYDISKSDNDIRNSTSVASPTNKQTTTENGEKVTTGIVYLSKEKVYAFRAVGLKPNTIHYLFINGNNNSGLAALGELNTSNTGAPDEGFVTRTTPWNTPLTSDSRGEIVGKYIIPAQAVTSGTHRLSLRNKQTISSGTDESLAEGYFSVSIDLKDPPVLINPPIANTDPKKPSNTGLVQANFIISGDQTIFAVANSTGYLPNGQFSLTFTDDTYTTNSTITAYEWFFGAVNTYVTCSSNTISGVGPHTITYTTVDDVQDVAISLKVTDNTAVISETTKIVTLRKLLGILDSNTTPNTGGTPSCTLTLLPTIDNEVTDIYDYYRWNYQGVRGEYEKFGYPYFGFVYNAITAISSGAIMKVQAKPDKNYEANVVWTVTNQSGPAIITLTNANVSHVYVSTGGSGYSNSDTIRFSNGQVDAFGTLTTNATGGIAAIYLGSRGNFSNGAPISTESYTSNSTVYNNFTLTGSGHTNTSVTVTLNGLVQVPGTDYSITTGGTILQFTVDTDFAVSPDVTTVLYNSSGVTPGTGFIASGNVRVQFANTTAPANSTNSNTSAGTGAALTITLGDASNSSVTSTLTNDILTLRSDPANTSSVSYVMVKADMYLANGYGNSIANVSQVMSLSSTANTFRPYTHPLTPLGGGGLRDERLFLLGQGNVKYK